MQMPDASRPDDFALEAVRQLDAFDNKSPTLSEADHLLRASVYQFNRDFAGARVHYQAVIDRFPESGTVPNARYQLARGLYNEAKYDQAVPILQTVLGTAFDSSPSDLGRDTVGLLGSSYVRLKQYEEAVVAYQTLIDRFPNNPAPERAYLNLIDALHEAGRYRKRSTGCNKRALASGMISAARSLCLRNSAFTWPRVAGPRSCAMRTSC